MEKIKTSSAFITGDGSEKLLTKQGDVVRNEARLKLWMSYELSAIKIQRLYRCWKFSHAFRSNIARKLNMKKYKLNSVPNLSDCFKRIINEESTHEEKMNFWRSIIELRKAHNTHSTDTLIKALVESKGDLSRAITLIGTKEFVAVNTTDLTIKVRKLFLPIPSLRHRDINLTNNSNYHNNRPNHTNLNSSSTNPFSQTTNLLPTSASNNIDLIRSLREKKRQSKKSELHDVLNSVLARAYFSKNHANKSSKQDVKKLQKQVNTHTVKAKQSRRNRLELEQTMNYLSATATKWNLEDS